MRIPESIKRPFREHPLTRRLYQILWRFSRQARFTIRERLHGRYYAAEFFDNLFTKHPDPWGFAGDPVSEERRERILAILPRQDYPRLLEIGSAEGWLTEWLARRSESMLAVDISRVALARARERCAGYPGLRFAQLDLLHDPINDVFEGIVCAGVLVFLPWTAQEQVRDRIVGALTPGGDLVLENFQAGSPGEVAGRLIHDLYRQHPALTVLLQEDHWDYAITLFRKAPTP